MPHLKVPDEVAGSPFEAIAVVRVPGWKETALWWPEQRALVVAEVVGTNSLFNAGAGGVGMHPMLRALPPGKLRGYEPEHLLTGHGLPVHGPDASRRARARLRAFAPRHPASAAQPAPRRPLAQRTQVGCQYSRCSRSEASGFQ